MSPIWKSNVKKKNKINIVSVRFKRLKSEHTFIVRIVLLFMCSITKIVNEKKTTTKTQIPICAYVTPSLEVGKCQSLKIFTCIMILCFVILSIFCIDSIIFGVQAKKKK